MKFSLPKSRYTFSRGTRNFLTMAILVGLSVWTMHNFDQSLTGNQATPTPKDVFVGAVLQWGGVLVIVVLGMLLARVVQNKLTLRRQQHPNAPGRTEIVIFGVLTLVIFVIGAWIVCISFYGGAYNILARLHPVELMSTDAFRNGGKLALVLDFWAWALVHYIWTGLTDGTTANRLGPPSRVGQGQPGG